MSGRAIARGQRLSLPALAGPGSPNYEKRGGFQAALAGRGHFGAGWVIEDERLHAQLDGGIRHEGDLAHVATMRKDRDCVFSDPRR